MLTLGRTESAITQARSGAFPTVRVRRNRKSEAIRRLLRETSLDVGDLVYPMFVTEELGGEGAIDAMPGQQRWTIQGLGTRARDLHHMGIPGILLFGLPAEKDERGSGAYARDGVVQRAVRECKEAAPDLLVITDVCLCEYTSHGHCGLLSGDTVDNDPTLDLLGATAVSHAAAGADIVAPSDMMDGRVGSIRRALDQQGYEQVSILAYSAKYSSAFYGPFREAAHSAPQFGDRRTYQMDPANGREAIREVELDVAEGADMVMVKPALAYLDVLRAVRQRVDLPLWAYNVSGEYSMVKAAAERGWIDEQRTTIEILTAIRRAGADVILTYHAPDVADWLHG